VPAISASTKKAGKEDVCLVVLDALGMEKQINTKPATSFEAQAVGLLDPVTELQLHCAKNKIPQPEFEFQEYGEPHRKHFLWKVSLMAEFSLSKSSSFSGLTQQHRLRSAHSVNHEEGGQGGCLPIGPASSGLRYAAMVNF
jgi:hypothetical protein